MAKPTDTVPPWATAGVYPPSVYGPTVPELVANPLSGLPTPWSGLARTEAGTLAAFAAQGLSPQIPTAAQEYNEWLQRVGKWSNWVEEGSELDGADDHIVETDVTGKICVQGGAFTIGVFGAGGAQVILGNGAILPGGKDLALGDASTITGGDGLIWVINDDLSVTVGDDAGLTFGANTVLTTGTNSTIDMVDNLSNLITGTVNYLPSSPLFSAGVSAWDGRALAVGDGTSAPRVAQPRYSYLLGPITTGAGLTPTGVSVTLQMRTGEKAKVVMSAAVRSDLVGNNIVTRIEANAVLLGNTQWTYEPIANALSSVFINRSELYTHAGADAAVVFVALYGANVGNTTADSISLTATHI